MNWRWLWKDSEDSDSTGVDDDLLNGPKEAKVAASEKQEAEEEDEEDEEEDEEDEEEENWYA